MAPSDEIRRALAHHELAGRLEFVGPPSRAEPRWRVRLPGQAETHSLTPAAARGLALGLDAWERDRLSRPGQGTPTPQRA